MLHSLNARTPTSSPQFSKLSPHPLSSSSPPLLLRFRTTYREKLIYLKTLGIIDSNPKKRGGVLSHETLDQILSLINSLKSNGFTESDITKLASNCPKLFSSDLDSEDLSPVFEFLNDEVQATKEEACGLILRCPQALFSNVEYTLKPTLAYLKGIGLKKLNLPTNLNAHLLNTRVVEFEKRMALLRKIGLNDEESKRMCARLPAIFGYSVEHNLMPKFEFLVGEMDRSVDELKDFPQYFAFSLKNRIMPRHFHLKQRDVNIPLKRMLLWGDEKFYAKWK